MSPKIERRSDSTAPRFGVAALEADLLASLSAALDIALAEAADDRRRPGAYGVAALPWCQGATAAH